MLPADFKSAGNNTERELIAPTQAEDNEVARLHKRPGSSLRIGITSRDWSGYPILIMPAEADGFVQGQLVDWIMPPSIRFASPSGLMI
jgi:hypothetical protein